MSHNDDNFDIYEPYDEADEAAYDEYIYEEAYDDGDGYGYYGDEAVYEDAYYHEAHDNAYHDEYGYHEDDDGYEREYVRKTIYAEDFAEPRPFWTRRRIFIVIIVIIMILSLIVPQLLQFIAAASQNPTIIPIGPTPTALPSI